MDKKPPKKTNKIKFDPKKWGLNIDKNEYYEIVKSNSARPDESFRPKSF